MFSIYIKNYLNPSTGQMVTTEAKMYDIPSEYSSDNMLLEPKITMEMGKAGSFEFKMEPNHPYYNSLQQMKTIMRVTYEDTTLFRGRVLTIDNTLYGEKSVHLEGDLAFLLDSYQPAVIDEYQTKKSLESFIVEVIDQHNSNVEADKKFTLGQVPGKYSSSIPADMRVTIDSSIDDSTKKYNTNSWSQTMNVLDGLTGQHGGYWRTRYENGTTYLDWYRNYYNAAVNPQEMRVGRNLLDLSNTLEVSNLFTAIIPIGSRKGKSLYINDKLGRNYMTVPDIVQWYSDSELNTAFHSKEEYANAIDNYGYIYKTVQFGNADDVDTLFKYAKDWIKNNYHGGISSFDIAAVDLHMAGENIRPFLVGDLLQIVYPNPNGGADLTGKYVLLKASYDLYNPDNNDYSVGIPDMALNKTYGETSTTSTSTGSSRRSGGGSPKKKASDQEGDSNSIFDKLFGDNDNTKNNLFYKIWRFMDTGEWPDDGGESKTDNMTTTNDDMDSGDSDIISSILRGDGIKTAVADFVKSNVLDQFTVGGTNTTKALTHMAGASGGGTWRGSSPIILDGKTGNIISRKGTLMCLQIDIGSIAGESMEAHGSINMAGQIQGTNLEIHTGQILINEDSEQTWAIKVKSKGGIELDEGSINVAKGNIGAPFGNIETSTGLVGSLLGTVYGKILRGDEIYTKEDEGDGGVNLAKASFVNCKTRTDSSNPGKIFFDFYGPQNTSSNPVVTVNFNMADTRFYKDAVAAAKAEGEKEGGDVSISIDADSTAYSTKGNDNVRIFSSVSFTKGKWYRFTVSAGSSEKDYAIYIN